MGIFKLTKGELKKIFLKPGIFVVTALLVLVLALSGTIFKVDKRNDTQVFIDGATISQMYDKSYGSNQNSNVLSKVYLNTQFVEPSKNIISFYTNELTKEQNSKKTELYSLVSNSKQLYMDLSAAANTSDNITSKNDEIRNNLKQSIMDFNSRFKSLVGGNNGFYYLLITSEEKQNFDVFMSQVLTQPFGDMPYSATVNKIYELDIFNKFDDFIDNLLVFMPSKEAIEQSQTNLNKAISNIKKIETDIENFKTNFSNDSTLEKKQEFRNLMIRYQQATINIYKLTSYTVNDSALSKFTDDQIQSLYQFKNSEYNTKYSIKEQKSICQYYLDTNKYAFEYANPLSLTTSSNAEANVYDFMYFALELCCFIIIIYVLYLGATMIAGEYQNGTMKLLAIRPYSRNKILFSKLLATVTVGLIFLLLTFIVTFIAGGILFGIESMNILLVFNASLVTSVSPIVSILFLFLTKAIEIIFYAIFALCISTLFKSNVGSVVVSVLIYFITFVLRMFTVNLGIIKYIPFLNTNLFGYFGSNSINASGSVISNLFKSIIANDMNFFISFGIIALFSAILYAITSVVFKVRDINK